MMIFQPVGRGEDTRYANTVTNRSPDLSYRGAAKKANVNNELGSECRAFIGKDGKGVALVWCIGMDQ